MVNRRQLIKISALGTASFAAPSAYSVGETTMSYNTGNPIGSTDPRDLSDNAKSFDNFANGPGPTYKDRFGADRKSIPGMNAEFDADQAQRNTAFQGSQAQRDTEFQSNQTNRQSAYDQAQVGRTSEFAEDQATRKSQFDNLMESSGYSPVGNYADSPLLIERYSQYVMKDGQPYRLSSLAAVPYTTTGDWATESDAFVLLGDDVLRQELASPSHGSNKVAFPDSLAPAYLKTVSDILNGLPVHLNRFVSREKHLSIAEGTNTDNLRTNIQEAFDSGAGKLLVGQGVYNYETDRATGLTLLLRPSVSLEGFGPNSILKNVGDSTAMTFLGDASGDGPRATYRGSPTRMESVSFKDFTLEGNPASLDGMNLQYTEKLGSGTPKFSNVTVKGHGRDGIYWAYGDGLLLDGCELLYNGRNNLYVFANANTMQVFGGSISGAKTGSGVYLNQVASSNSFWGVCMHDNAGSALLAQRCEQLAMYSCGMNGNGQILGLAPIRLIGDAAKYTESVIIKGLLLGDNNRDGADIVTNYVKSVSFENTYVYATSSTKPYIFRLGLESRGVVINGTRWKYTNGTPEKVSIVSGAESTVNYTLIDDEAQNATDGIADGSETKQVDQHYNTLREVRPRSINSVLLQIRVTGAENTPYWMQRANGRQEFCRDGNSANGVQYWELDTNGRLATNARYRSTLGYIADGADYTSRPFQAGTKYLWWDSFGKVRTKEGPPNSAQDGAPLGQKVPVPANSTSAGAQGDWATSATFLYVYIGDGTTHAWARTALSSW